MKKNEKIILALITLIYLGSTTALFAGNPLVPNKGVNDPHIHIFNGKAYLSASHDASADNPKFIMEDWWMWSSDDLVNWELESVLKPEDTYIGKPFAACWATDIVTRNGKYYWYFSEANQQTGVVVGDSPAGPWTDVLKKPLLTSDMTPTHEYDMGVFEGEDGEFYIVFGVWDYYIAKLNENMVSLAEKPRKIEISNPRGPYNLDGKNSKKPTDDKPFIHAYNGKYYLSWGCFYAMSDNLYGPYDYKGSVMDITSFKNGLEAPTWPTGPLQGRHGSFFEWHNQWYFAYCDVSQTGNRYFRDTFISYVHYKANGEMALVRVDLIGVGEYDAKQGLIEAEDYFKSYGTNKKESSNGFVVQDIDDEDFLVYPNVSGLKGMKEVAFNLETKKQVVIEIRKGSDQGEILASGVIPSKHSGTFNVPLSVDGDKESLCFVFKGSGKRMLEFDSFKIEY